MKASGVTAITIAICTIAHLAVAYPSKGKRSGGSSGYGSGGASAQGYGGGNGASAGGYGYAGGNAAGSSAAEALKSNFNNFDGYDFNFGYDIEDNVYGNFQSRKESGSADPKGTVTGSYSVLDPDGNKRTVDYVADGKTGFRAIIRDRNGVKEYGYDSGSDGDDGSYGGGGEYGAGSYGGSSSGSAVGGTAVYTPGSAAGGGKGGSSY